MKEILDSYRTTELRAFINEHNKKVRKLVREELKGIRLSILKKRLLDIKGKKREDIIKIMVANPKFFKQIKKKRQIPQADLDFVLDKILQPLLTKAYEEYERDRDLDELEDAVTDIRKKAKANGLKSFQTKGKMIKMIVDDTPPRKKKAPAKPSQPPKFIYSPRVKALVLRERPKAPTRKAPTKEEVMKRRKEAEDKKKREYFDPEDVHTMTDGTIMTYKKHNEFSRPLTEEEIKRVKAVRKAKKEQTIRQQEKIERDRQTKEKQKKRKDAIKKITDPKSRAKILRKANKRLKVTQEGIDKLKKLDQDIFGETEAKNLFEIEKKVIEKDIDEKEQTYIKRLVKKYATKEAQEKGKEEAKKAKKKAPPKPKAPPKGAKAPTFKKNPDVNPLFQKDAKTQELILKALPPSEAYDKEDQGDLYEELFEKYLEIVKGDTTLKEVQEDSEPALEKAYQKELKENKDAFKGKPIFDEPEFNLFFHMVKNNLFTDVDNQIEEAKKELREKERQEEEFEAERERIEEEREAEIERLKTKVS